MKQTLAVVLTGAMVLAIFGLVASAASSTYKTTTAQTKPQGFVVEGKVVETGSDWFALSVTRVIRGQGLKVGEQLKIMEAAKTKFFEKGKTVGRDALKAGERLRVQGMPGKAAAYEATTITILK